MLSIARPHRQLALTTLVVVGTIVPTLIVGFSAWRVQQAGHVHQVAAELGRDLGLMISLEAVKYPTPSELLLIKPVIRQVETEQRSHLAEIARADEIRIVHTGGQVVVQAVNLHLRGDRPRQVAGELTRLLQRLDAASSPRIGFHADRCTLDLGPGRSGPIEFTLRKLAGSIRKDGAVPTLAASYQVEGLGVDNRCELVLARDGRGRQVESTLTLRQVEGPALPARVLDLFIDSESWLGTVARVKGEVALRQTLEGDWRALFRGTLSDVDLGVLVGERFPDHRMSGLARLEFQEARWGERPSNQGMGWTGAEGSIHAGPGRIGSSLLRAMAEDLHVRIAGRPASEGDLPFGALGLAFRLTSEGEIHLKGALGPDTPPDTLLVDTDALAPLALAPEGAASVQGLIRMLGPENPPEQSLVPTTPESHVLRYLPLPSTLPAPKPALAN